MKVFVKNAAVADFENAKRGKFTLFVARRGEFARLLVIARRETPKQSINKFVNFWVKI